MVDMIWAIDEELDEIIGDSKNILAVYDDSGASDNTESPTTTVLGNAVKAKKAAEEDKETLISIVKKFLVCNPTFPYLLS